MKKIVASLILISGLSGFAIYPYSVYTSLGVIDVNRSGASLEKTFKCPKDPSSLTFVFHDAKGATRESCGKPDWPLVLNMSIVDQKSGASILSNHLSSANMKFTNWQLPSTSVLLDLPYLKNVLKEGSLYTFRLKVETAMSQTTQGEVYIVHLVNSKKEKERLEHTSAGDVANRAAPEK